MIKKILISTLTFYKVFISVFLNSVLGIKSNCRFEETCSAYSKRVINESGAAKGLILTASRILKCQPLYRGSLAKEAIS